MLSDQLVWLQFEMSKPLSRRATLTITLHKLPKEGNLENLESDSNYSNYHLRSKRINDSRNILKLLNFFISSSKTIHINLRSRLPKNVFTDLSPKCFWSEDIALMPLICNSNLKSQSLVLKHQIRFHNNPLVKLLNKKSVLVKTCSSHSYKSGK